MSAVCRDCSHYVHEQGEESGRCYRYPPTATLMMISRPGEPPVPQPVSLDTIVELKRRACGEFSERSRLVTLN